MAIAMFLTQLQVLFQASAREVTCAREQVFAYLCFTASMCPLPCCSSLPLSLFLSFHLSPFFTLIFISVYNFLYSSRFTSPSYSCLSPFSHISFSTFSFSIPRVDFFCPFPLNNHLSPLLCTCLSFSFAYVCLHHYLEQKRRQTETGK